MIHLSNLFERGRTIFSASITRKFLIELLWQKIQCAVTVFKAIHIGKPISIFINNPVLQNLFELQTIFQIYIVPVSGRPKIRWEDNIIWDLKKVDYEGDWKNLAQDMAACRAYVLAGMNLRIPYCK